jgi:hypothetical protein
MSQTTVPNPTRVDEIAEEAIAQARGDGEVAADEVRARKLEPISSGR